MEENPKTEPYTQRRAAMQGIHPIVRVLTVVCALLPATAAGTRHTLRGGGSRKPAKLSAGGASESLERETGFEPATLSLGREDEPEGSPLSTLS